jgi:hypothetical protein
MNAVVEMPFDRFFSADKKPSAFRDIVTLGLSQRRTLTCRITTNAVFIDAEQAASTELRLFGTWTAPSLENSLGDDVGAKLILPLLFNATKIELPHDQLYTLGHSYRSIADFFTRNLYLAVLRDAPVVFRKQAIDKVSAQQLHALRRQYFYILKAEFAEDCFQARNAEDALNFVFINTYLPVLQFSNPLLRRGAETLRRCVAIDRHIDLAPLKAQILKARAAVMSLIES